jgi:GTPase SAR1 family protein
MKIVKKSYLSDIPVVSSDVDKDDLPYIPTTPLPKRGSLYVCGSPASGKTTLMTSLLLSHPTRKSPQKPRYYYRYFDRVEIVSNSLATLPLKKFGLPESQVHGQYTDELLNEITQDMHDDENYNSLIILDDCIRDLSRSKILTKVILNRRHCTHNPSEEGHASLSIWISSQKYNMLPLSLRCNMSHVIVFRTTNKAELNAIKDELMTDLNPEQQDAVLKLAWDRPYGFLFVDVYAPRDRRYFANFDLIEVD